jgi:hypothetical protein
MIYENGKAVPEGFEIVQKGIDAPDEVDGDQLSSEEHEQEE